MHDPSDRDLERLFALDDAPGPARPVDAARSAAIISGALGGAGFPPPGGAGGAGGAGAKPIAASGAVQGVAATKLALLAGGAVTAIAAMAWLALRSPHESPAPTAAATSHADAPARGSAALQAPDRAATVNAPEATATAPAATATAPAGMATAPAGTATAPEARATPADRVAEPAASEPVRASDPAIRGSSSAPSRHPPAKPGSHR
jgi:hypothetical protein